MIVEGRHPRFVALERQRLASIPPLAVGQRWDWNDADHHQVEVLALEAPGPGAEFPWPRVTFRFVRTGTAVVVGAPAFVGATRAAG